MIAEFIVGGLTLVTLGALRLTERVVKRSLDAQGVRPPSKIYPWHSAHDRCRLCDQNWRNLTVKATSDGHLRYECSVCAGSYLTKPKA